MALIPSLMSYGTTGHSKPLYVEPVVQHTIVFIFVTGDTAPKAIQIVIPAGATQPTVITGDYQKAGLTRMPTKGIETSDR